MAGWGRGTDGPAGADRGAAAPHAREVLPLVREGLSAQREPQTGLCGPVSRWRATTPPAQAYRPPRLPQDGSGQAQEALPPPGQNRSPRPSRSTTAQPPKRRRRHRSGPRLVDHLGEGHTSASTAVTCPPSAPATRAMVTLGRPVQLPDSVGRALRATSYVLATATAAATAPSVPAAGPSSASAARCAQIGSTET